MRGQLESENHNARAVRERESGRGQLESENHNARAGRERESQCEGR